MIFFWSIFFFFSGLQALSADEASSRIGILQDNTGSFWGDAKLSQTELESLHDVAGITLPDGQYVSAVEGVVSRPVVRPVSSGVRKKPAASVFGDNSSADLEDFIEDDTSASLGQTLDSKLLQKKELSANKSVSRWSSIARELQALNALIGGGSGIAADITAFLGKVSNSKTTVLQSLYTSILKKILPGLKKNSQKLDQIVWDIVSKGSKNFVTDGKKYTYADPNNGTQYSDTDLILIIKLWINQKPISAYSVSSTPRGASATQLSKKRASSVTSRKSVKQPASKKASSVKSSSSRKASSVKSSSSRKK